MLLKYLWMWLSELYAYYSWLSNPNPIV